MMTPARARSIADYVALDSVEQEIRDALLDFAAMVERCEEIKVEYPFDVVINTANYILKGATDERK